MKRFLHFTATFSAIAVLAMSALGQSAQSPKYTWKYYRPSNTGIQGDYCDALWIAPDGDPWIGGYNPSFEEGGIAKLIQADNRWINVSNVDYPAIGHPDKTGVVRISDIVADGSGNLWMATGAGALKFNPSIGPSSLRQFDSSNSGMTGGWARGVELAPDGTLWFSAYSTAWGSGGLRRYNPTTNVWTAFPNYGDGEVAVQPRSGGGYYVWATNTTTGQIARWNSVSATWTQFAINANEPWELLGKGAVDAAGNAWMIRLTGASYALQTLDCRRPDGTWVNVPQPPASSFNLYALRAFGTMQALVSDFSGTIYRFDGVSWTSLGKWTDTGWYASDIQIDGNGVIWVCGTTGAARRDPISGVWKRFRVTNSSQFDFFNNDLALDPLGPGLIATANAGTGAGGMVQFDGVRWTGFNQLTYGQGFGWPFPTDNSTSVAYRPSQGPGAFVVNPMYNGIHQFVNGQWTALAPSGTAVRMKEDSLGRLWVVGEYFNVRYFQNGQWTNVPILGWGSNIEVDPDRPGTVWVCANGEVVRTDGQYRVSWANTDFLELNAQSDVLTSVAVGRNGIAWLGTTTGVIRLDANNHTYQYYPPGQKWMGSGAQIEPRAVTPDGRFWFTNFGDGSQGATAGLGWFDGKRWGFFPGPNPSGSPQWGGLPHAQVYAVQQRKRRNGYELWLSCPSRGLARLTVTYGP